MLKALQLCGFKSFADKTRFEFPPGITVVVGPNGSGKSNIVDAMKWVLGEQSAKSLRGREMADVIFKGSGGSAALRRPANTAEVTIFFDNTDGRIPLDDQEVRVTRRVYRSGEGEYLINGNPCRLRDVRDLFRGTGVGTDAYSLIEQGKVDTLLQASPRERRAIFEEAAGISRFKAKKVETQRRLERVEQNLTRLADIVEEVESRLKSVRSQATKARRYKEYTDRLKQLRTHVGRVDWCQLTERLHDLQAQLETSVAESQRLQSEIDTTEAELQRSDLDADELAQALRTAEGELSSTRQQMATCHSTHQHGRQRLADLEHERARFRRQYRGMTARADDLTSQLEQLRTDLSDAEVSADAVRLRATTAEAELAEATRRLETLRTERDRQRKEHASHLRRSADLGRTLSGLEAEQQTTAQSIERVTARAQQLDHDLVTHRTELEEQEREESDLARGEAEAREELNRARRSLSTAERRLADQQQQLVDLQRRHAVASERARVLHDLERRKEGLHPGVKDLLIQAEDVTFGPLATVYGMVADLIRVDVPMAPMIDVALGELTQFVIVQDDTLINSIANGSFVPKGRVGILDLSTLATRPFRALIDFSERKGVLGRADQFVEVDRAFRPLVEHLLGDTWCVETVADALRLYAEHPLPVRFVSRGGELFECHGRLLAGSRQAASGLVSRRSELRSLQLEITQLAQEISLSEERVAKSKLEIAAAETDVDQRSTNYDQIATQLMDLRVTCRAARDRVASAQSQLDGIRGELTEVTEQFKARESRRIEVKQELDLLAQEIADVESALTRADTEVTHSDQQVREQSSRVTQIQVELAKSEQRVDDLRGRVFRAQEDQQERSRALKEIREQLQNAERRIQDNELALLGASSQLAELYLQSETHEREIHQRLERQRALHLTRTELQQTLVSVRQQWVKADARRHQTELEASQLSQERNALAQRVRDDYGIELAEAVGDDHGVEDPDASLERDEIDREISELRKRLSNIGAVNMAALEEIEALEERHHSLDSQYQDLVAAKDSLARIIQRINTDSRRLFTESLEAIRTNFQAMFRRVFGGGQADIVLEEGVDILEAGIDIIATPPGKQSLGISLLSGGERALTAVTLLMSIFQYRPSPFCVLDEVDGPLDEANIGRFIDVLNEFLKWTKFVVVTHSKKTMTAATTLYGVTMQESGVSKRVSVQFDDVSDDGHIRQQALDRQPTEASEDEEQGDDERGAA